MGKHDSWWNRRIAGVPQHQGYIDDPDNIPETVLQQDPYGGKYLKDSVKRPGHYVDQATYYTPKYRPEVDEAAQRAAHNAALAQQAQAKGFKFNEGGQVPMMGDKDVKKITQKDRYGNQISYEFEAPVKPLDQTAIVKEMLKEGGEGSMSMGVPPMADHPGEPMGTDTVPAWLTPGEFVVNAEATQMFGPQIEAMNNQGRAVQANKGMMIPNMPAGYQEGGMIPAPFIAGPRLNDAAYMQPGGWLDPSQVHKPEGGWLKPPVMQHNRTITTAPNEHGFTTQRVVPVKAHVRDYEGGWLNTKPTQGSQGYTPPIGGAVDQAAGRLADGILGLFSGSSPSEAPKETKKETKSSPSKQHKYTGKGKSGYEDYGKAEVLENPFDRWKDAKKYKAFKNASPWKREEMIKDAQGSSFNFGSLFKADGGMIPNYYKEGSWVTEELLDKLAEVESGGDNEAVSPVGAIGKYQWLPKSAKQAGYGIKAFDPKDEKSARAATKQYLENMAKYHDFTPEEALRAYNWGPGNVLKYKGGKRKDIPSEALNYPGKILGIENTQGVTPPPGEAPPLPTARPGSVPQEQIPTPTPRPGQENWWDKLTGALGFEGGGMVPKYYQVGDEVTDGYGEDYSNPVPIGNTSFQVPQANISKPLTDVSKGHKMFGGDETFANKDEVKEDPWYAPLLGHRSKEALNIPLNENEQRLATDDYKEYHAFNPSLVGDDPVGELGGDGIDGEAQTAKDLTTVPGESLVGQVDDLSGAKKDLRQPPNQDQVRNQLATDLEQSSEIDQDEEAGMDKDISNIQAKGAEEVAKDPTITEQASNLIQETFGSLFDPKELARMAVMYAGGRALGYSHQGSLRSAAKSYVQRVDAKQTAKVAAAGTREKRAFELAKTDKFTPASVSAYRASGNPADLVSKKSTAGVTPTGVTEQRIGPGGKKVSVQQVKTADGSTGYQLPNGKIVNKAQLENATKKYDPSFDKGTSEYRTRRARSVKSSESLFKEIQGREDAYKKDDETKYSTDILPQQAAQDFWTFAESYGIDPESDEAQDLMGAAYRQAIAQASIEGAPRAKNLKNFLEASYIRQQTGAPELFQVNLDKDAKEQAKYVRSDKMAAFTSRLDNVADFIPTLQNATKTDKRNQMTGALVTKWGSLTEKQKAQWNRKANEGQETGFYLFAMNEADEWITTKKLGE